MNIITLQNNFAFGQISEEFQERTDAAQRNASVKTLHNMIPDPRGSVRTRPGIKYDKEIPQPSAGLKLSFVHTFLAKGTPNFWQVVLIFGHNTAASGLALFYEDLNGSTITPNGTLPSTAFNNVNNGTNIVYEKDLYCFVDRPGNNFHEVFFPDNTVAPVQWTVGNRVTASGNITWTAAPWTSSTYPNYCVFYQGRRWCFRLSEVWASKPQSYQDFTVGTGSASDAIVGSLESGDNVAWAYGVNELILSTFEAQYTINSIGGVIYAGDIDFNEQFSMTSVRHQPRQMHDKLLFKGGDGIYSTEYDEPSNKWRPKLEFPMNYDFNLYKCTWEKNKQIIHYDTNGDYYEYPNEYARVFSKDITFNIQGFSKAYFSSPSDLTLIDIVSMTHSSLLGGTRYKGSNTKVINRVFFSQDSSNDVVTGYIDNDVHVPLDMWVQTINLAGGTSTGAFPHLKNQTVYFWYETDEGEQITSGPYTVSGTGVVTYGDDRDLFDDGAGGYYPVYGGLAFTQTLVTWPLDKGSNMGSGRVHAKRYQEVVLKTIGNSGVMKVNDQWDEEYGDPLGQKIPALSSSDYKYFADGADEDATLTLTMDRPMNIHIGAICGKVTQDKV